MKTGAHGVVGYVWAVVSASLTSVIATLVIPVFLGEGLSAVFPYSERVRQLAIMSGIFFLITTFGAFFLAILPATLLHAIAKRFAIQSPWYYVICGALIGLALAPLVIAIVPSWYTDPPEVPPFWMQTLYFARATMPSGAIGGLVYWAVTGRFVQRHEIASRDL